MMQTGMDIDAQCASARDVLQWDWNYQTHSSRIEDLYRKATAEYWNAETAVDWSRTVDPGRPLLSPTHSLPVASDLYKKLNQSQRERLTAGVTAMTFSQILHGEQGALMVSGQLTQLAPHMDMKLCAAAQTMDE